MRHPDDLAVFAIVLLAGVVLVTVRGLLLRPLEHLNGKLARLADGDPGEPVENREELCAELRQLADVHDRLRAGVRRPLPDERGDA